MSRKCVPVAVALTVITVIATTRTTYAAKQDAAGESQCWFPDFREHDLALDRPPVQSVPVQSIQIQDAAPASIPLPPAAWTGLSGLAAAGIFGSFKSLRRLLLR